MATDDLGAGRIRRRRCRRPRLSPGHHLGRLRLHGRTRCRALARPAAPADRTGSDPALHRAGHSAASTGSASIDRSISGIAAAPTGMRCVPDGNPFVSHAFLADGSHGCLRADWGWQAHHLGLYVNGRLVAAAPLYLKGNSHGEFVFDWSWASAWERAGGDVLPEVAERRALLAGARSAPARRQRAEAADCCSKPWSRDASSEADRLGLSSVHANFLSRGRSRGVRRPDWLAAFDLQFHWHNRGYRRLRRFPRRTQPQEAQEHPRRSARQVETSGLTIECAAATTLGHAEWRQLHALYEATFDVKGNHAALTARVLHSTWATLGPTAAGGAGTRRRRDRRHGAVHPWRRRAVRSLLGRKRGRARPAFRTVLLPRHRACDPHGSWLASSPVRRASTSWRGVSCRRARILDIFFRTRTFDRPWPTRLRVKPWPSMPMSMIC